MSGFSDFSEEDKLIIVSLPYRIGVWISGVDDNVNTKYDDNIELKELEETLNKLAAQGKQRFAASISKHTLNSKKAWRDWQGKSDEVSVLEDLNQALETGEKNLEAEQLAEYKKMLWHIGLSVARSFGEHIDPDHEMHMNRFFSKFFGGGHKSSKENVSDAEKIALKKLQSILKA